jgi:RNA polymerase primary sigma factor
MRFAIGRKTDYSLEEVGKQFAVTRERIRQIQVKASRKLRLTGCSTSNLERFVEHKQRRQAPSPSPLYIG